jgi:hypothetical protein
MYSSTVTAERSVSLNVGACRLLLITTLLPEGRARQGAQGGADVHHPASLCALEGGPSPMNQPEPNDALADVLRAAGVSNKALGRAVGSDHTSVSRWLSGVQPRPVTARKIADFLSGKLGQRIELAEIGMSVPESVSPSLGIAYPDTVSESVEILGKLWIADLDELRQLIDSPADGHAWSEVSLSWLVRPDEEAIARIAAGGRVGISDISMVQTTASLFSELDNRFGGGHGRRALIQNLNSDAKRMLSGSYSDETARRLYAAVSEATLLAAWMSYDAGMHGIAQRYFIQALRLAQAAQDELLAGSILDAMSHQATFLGRHREAANLARAAQTGTRGKATATLTAHFYAMEARALAIGGDASGAEKALGAAVRVFERRKPGHDPEWISYFDDAELSAEFSHCFRDLGRGKDTVTYAERALAGAANVSARSDFFVMMVKAAGQLKGRTGTPRHAEVDEACATVTHALEVGAQVKSARCVQYLREVRAALDPFAHLAAVRELEAAHSDHSLWLASSRN